MTMLSAAQAHSIGRVRKRNEDAAFMFTSEFFRMNQSFWVGLYIVADGLGGHADGDIASSAAISGFVSFFFRSIYPKIFNDSLSDEEITVLLQDGVLFANETLTLATENGATTFSALLLNGDKGYILHVGDSRIYHFSQVGEISTLTRDHSMAQRLFDEGYLSEVEFAHYPHKNVLERCLGNIGFVNADCSVIHIEEGDTFLLCCDGLWGELKIADMRRIVYDEQLTLNDKVHTFVAMAEQNGGKDNITCLLAQRK